jgi:starch phosphorylase
MYREGYFQQSIDDGGTQVATYPVVDPEKLPLSPLLNGHGEKMEIPVTIGDRVVYAQVWTANVGTVFLFLLDTDLSRNNESDRKLSARLYGGDRRMRIEQELLLGTGAISLLESDPSWPEDVTYHLNEGHCAFAQVERLRRKILGGLSEEDAWKEIRETTVFTTHTPVPAGNEEFEPALIEEYLKPVLAPIGIETTDFLAHGRDPENRDTDPFSMTIFALKTSRASNGVAQLHGQISKKMWNRVWPEKNLDDVPITAITNGVHLPTWLGPEVQDLLADETEITLGGSTNASHWDQIESVDNTAVWQAHITQKSRLIHAVRNQLLAHQEPWAKRAVDRLRDDVFTVGFARRFAPYKRASLLLEFPDLLAQMLEETPMQILFAGKAHPADIAGQALIQEIVTASRSERFAGRIVFVEGYNMDWGRLLTQGVDLWLNNPIRPREASGTSGMKAAANGVPNCSILDGWWEEGYGPEVGWAIPSYDEIPDLPERSRLEAKALIELLQQEVIPLYHQKDPDGLSIQWVKMMKRSMARLSHPFSAQRMVGQYLSDLYRTDAS